jgi:hypothetical protein
VTTEEPIASPLRDRPRSASSWYVRDTMATRKTKTKAAKKTRAKTAKSAKKTKSPKKAPPKKTTRSAPKKTAKKAAKKVAKKAAKKAPTRSAKKAPRQANKKPSASARKTSAKRAPAASAKSARAAAPARAARPAGAAKPSKSSATYLGRADSMNASISLLLVDGAAAADAWKGVDPDDIDAIERMAGTLASLGGDLDTGKATHFTLGKSTGLGFQLSVGKGIAHVFRAKDRLVIAEGFVDDVENPEFLGWVAGPPSKNATDAGTLDVECGVLALLLPGGAYEDLPTRLTQRIDDKSAARVGSDSPGLLVKVTPARYRLLVEPETTGAFGHAARALLERA